MTVTAIVVNYRTERLVNQLCENLGRLPEISAVVIVDNSGEMEATGQADIGAKLELISSRANIGFGRGVNAGLSHVMTDWVLIINPDVRLEASCVRRLLNAAYQFMVF